MYYLGMLRRNLKDVVIFRSPRLNKKEKGHFVKVLGPYHSEQAVRDDLQVLNKMYGYRENPATSERQRRFMCAELGRLRAGKRTETGMRESQLRDFCIKHNPPSCGCESMSPTMKKLTYIRKVGAKTLGKEGLSSLLKTLATKEDIESAYKLLLGKSKKNPGISLSQIKRGTIHELEHTTDRKIAKQIAMDHLKEDPKYYTHLAKMEKQYKKNVMSADKAMRLTKKVIAYAKDLREEYQKNPGQSYHDQKFLMYMKELEKYKLGSVPYIRTLAKAYEHLESAKESMR